LKKHGVFNLSNDDILMGVWHIHQSRPKHAREVDEGESARITENPFLWMSDPSRYDFPLTDTITKQEPRGYTKERGRRASNELRGFFNI